MNNIEKIRQEIERRTKFHDDAIKACTGLNNITLTHSAGWKEDTELLAFINSLQPEQSETDLNTDIEMEWDSFNKHLNESGEKSEHVVWLNWNSFADVARYFYELGLKAK